MRITLELHGCKYIVEETGDDFNAQEMKEIFSRLMVAATFPPSVIEDGEGHWEYKED